VIITKSRSYKKQELLIWVNSRFMVASVLLMLLVYCVMFFCFVCVRPVSCAPNVVSFSRLSCLDWPFRFP